MLALSLRNHLKTLTQFLTSLNQSQTSLYHSPPPSPISVLSSPFSSKQQRQEEDDDGNDAVSRFNRHPNSSPRLFVVQPRLRPDSLQQDKLSEALSLASSLEEQHDGYFETGLSGNASPHHVVVQNPILRSSKARADTYFGPGTVETIKSHINYLDTKGMEEEVDAVFVNSILTGIQQRNLERAWGKPVLDRVALIIEIFNAHAHTKEAKLQAELAALMYKKTRLVRVRGSQGRHTFGATGLGEAEVVSARGRGSGGRGFISGAGETELQLQRRRISERRNRLLILIEEVRRTRALQRAARKRHVGSHGQGLATVAVVGYTNAGKSTLVSALSESDLYADSRLFATLDPRLKSAELPSGRKVLFSDTVGFISDLPVQLVEAFHATLEEVVEADLLLHVVDSTAPNLNDHRTTVWQVLKQIGVSEEKLQNMVEVWNKIDCEVKEQDADEGQHHDASSLTVNGSEHQVIGLSAEAEDKKSYGFSEVEDGKVDFQETIAIEEDDYSDSASLSEDDNKIVREHHLRSMDGHAGKASNDVGREQDLQAQVQHGPHVKISALTGVGLQELLQLIDERLEPHDQKLETQDIAEKGIVGRKWRPPCAGDLGMEVEK